MIDDLSSIGARMAMKWIAEGLRIHGREVREFPLDIFSTESVENMRTDLQEFAPDAIFWVNHSSTVFWERIGLNRAPCAFVTFLFDNPFFLGIQSYDPTDYVFAFDSSTLEESRALGAKQNHFCPVAAPDRIEGTFREEYNHPLAYVGSIFIDHEARLALPASMGQYLNRIVHLKLLNPEIPYERLIESNLYEGGIQLKLNSRFYYYLYSESNRLYRLQMLKPLAKQGLVIYGNSAWKTQTQGTPLATCFRGRLDPFRDYPDQIVSTRININLQDFSAPPLRDFLVMRLGGFQLVSRLHDRPYDWHSIDPENRFHLDRIPPLPTFRTSEELTEKVSYYLGNESKRNESMKAIQEEILRYHTYAHRLEQIGEVLDREYKNERNRQ